MSGGLFGRINYRLEAVAVEDNIWLFNPTPFQQAWIPVHDRNDLISNDSFRQFGRPADNGGNADTAFEESSFCADPFSGVTATTMGHIVVSLRMATAVVFVSNVRAIFC